MASGGLDSMTLGENVIIGGLVVQILFFTCFVVSAGIFHARLVRVPTRKSMQVSVLPLHRQRPDLGPLRLPPDRIRSR